MTGVRKITIVPMLQRGHAVLDALRPILRVRCIRNAEAWEPEMSAQQKARIAAGFLLGRS
ncbi:hypothetical protein AO254_19825 [Pseudomonas syringae]|nr:hypothetical protein AO254_19825 [Pseudomonas syringae]